jgi:hypothetical protein
MATDRRYPGHGLALVLLLGGCGGGFDDAGLEPGFGADAAQARPAAAADSAWAAEAAPAAHAAPAPHATAAPPAADPARGTAAAGPPAGVRCENRRLDAIETGTIVVPAGSACRLDGTRVEGSIEVEPGARLEAYDIELRAGEVRAGAAAQVVLAGRSRIAGSVQVAGGGEVEVAGARIAGDLRIDAQSGPVLAHGNQVGGNLLAAGNRGGATILGNRVSGQLRCEANEPAPMGGGNASAYAGGQCRRL